MPTHLFFFTGKVPASPSVKGQFFHLFEAGDIVDLSLLEFSISFTSLNSFSSSTPGSFPGIFLCHFHVTFRECLWSSSHTDLGSMTHQQLSLSRLCSPHLHSVHALHHADISAPLIHLSKVCLSLNTCKKLLNCFLIFTLNRSSLYAPFS